MNSHQKSDGNYFRGMAALALMVVLSGCVHKPKSVGLRPEYKQRIQHELAPSEVSLQADREKFEELRKSIPPEKRVANDEKALLAELTGPIGVHPSKSREKFQEIVRKKREEFRKKTRNLRDDFGRDERKRREEFLEKQKEERDDFNDRKPNRERSKKFFSEQDLKRREFFADEREQRNDFESEIRSHSRDFDSYMREISKEFNDLHRQYSQRYREWERQQKDKKNNQTQKIMKEFEQMNRVKGTPLTTDGQ